MPKNLLMCVLAFSSCWTISCATNAQIERESVSELSESSNSLRLTQLQLDAAFRKQSRINEETADLENKYEACCVIFPEEFKMLSKVFEHFEDHVAEDIDDYGILVQLNEEIYIVHLGPRYKQENQFFARGSWQPSVGESPSQPYRYTVDKKTLEIIEFIKVH